MQALAWAAPTRFHAVHGAHLRLDASRTRATREQSFGQALCFSEEPLAPGQLFLLEVAGKERGWCGHLRLGLTARDPRDLRPPPAFALPDLVAAGDSWVFALTRAHNRAPDGPPDDPTDAPDAPDGPHLRVGPFRYPRERLVGRSRPGRYSHLLDGLFRANLLPTARGSRVGVLFAPQPDGTADMHMVINGEDMGASARGLPAHRPLHAVVDVFGCTKEVRLVQLDYGLPSLKTLCRLTIQKHIVHRLAIEELDLPPQLKDFCKYE